MALLNNEQEQKQRSEEEEQKDMDLAAVVKEEMRRSQSNHNDDDSAASSPAVLSLSSNDNDHDELVMDHQSSSSSNSSPTASVPPSPCQDEAVSKSSSSSSLPPSPSSPSSLRHATRDRKGSKSSSPSESLSHSSSRTWGSLCGTLLRTLALDVPLLTMFSLFTIVLLVDKAHTNYLLPQMKLVEWTSERQETDITYFRRTCTLDDVSTHDATELYLDPSGGDTTEDAVEKMSRHGASIYPNLISPETAREVRSFILEQNLKGKDMIYVIENKNRWSFGIQVDQHPSIAKALREILTNDFLVQALERIVGENPAVIEFTGITSAYGAAEQGMHQDVIPDGSGAQYARNFVPSYSLFIPLQNTTGAMGATQVCPGTHMCATGANAVCEEHGFAVSGPRDNWPAGYGALVSQQTTHRGPGHTDPNGEHRVLFILTFAPRPRHGKHQVETRILGNGGSYSLHWSQWGHTLRDYVNVERNMMFPWRHLRSLGIYKPLDAQWGWDYLATSSQRIMHEELGFNADQFWETVEKIKSGVAEEWWWLPEMLWPRSAMKMSRRKLPTQQLWTEFLQATLGNFVGFGKYWYPRALAAYVAGMFVMHLFLVACRRRGFWKGLTLFRLTSRLIFWHTVIGALGCVYYYCHVGHGAWARNVQKGLHAHSLTTRNLYNPNLPCTLASNDDVLNLADFQSNYLASFANVLDYNHPGNVKWQGMIADYSIGYTDLSPALQGKLCSSLATWSKQYNAARLLTKNQVNQWSEMTPTLVDRFCHSQLLKSRPVSKKLTARVTTWVDFLISETRFGYWRETAMSSLHVQESLLSLQNKLMQYMATPRSAFRHGDKGRPKAIHLAESSSRTMGARATASTNAFNYSVFSTKPTAIIASPSPVALPKRNTLPPRPTIEPPSPSAWLQEGDVVEGLYNGQFDEFYRGRIDFANGFRGTWDVQYDDGEWDVGLCRKCVRPFVPYQVGEELEWRDENELFFKCQITKIHDDEGTVDIKLRANGKVMINVSPMYLRRKLQNADLSAYLKPGADVQAMFPDDPDGDGIFYPGVIREDLGDGLFVIDFDDGDVAEVPVSDIQPMM